MLCFVRFFFLLFLVATPLSIAKAEVAAPEIFEEFINGWVDYDDGSYASALRAFARARGLDPTFGPALGGMQASLIHMNMPEIAHTVGTRGYWFTKKIEYLPALAFWGLYSDSSFQLEGAEQIEQRIFELLQTCVDLPIYLVSPGSQLWEDRQSMIAAQYNLLALFSIDDNTGNIRLRFHLIEKLDVSQGNSLDLLASNSPNAWTVQHRAWTLELPRTEFIEGLKDPAVVDELQGLLFGEWQNADAPFQIDPETANLPDFADLDTIWEVFSKAAMHETPQAEWFFQSQSIASVYGNIFRRLAYHEGFLRWILSRSPKIDSLRPWLLAYDLRDGLTKQFWHACDSQLVTEELLNNYPQHLATQTLRFNQLIRELSDQNKDEYLPELRQILDDFLAYNKQWSLRSGRLFRMKSLLRHLADPDHPIRVPDTFYEVCVQIDRNSDQPYFAGRQHAMPPVEGLLVTSNEITNDDRADRYLKISYILAALLLESGERDAASAIINLALNKASGLHFEECHPDARFYWFHVRVAHAEQLFSVGKVDQALAEVNDMLIELDGDFVDYIGLDFSPNRSIGKHALNLKRQILEVSQIQP